jgi:hypothetical protein
MSNVLKIYKGKETMFSSEKKAIQSADIGTIDISAETTKTETKSIPHQKTFTPFCEVYCITDVGDTVDRGYECPFPQATSPNQFFDFEVTSKNLILKLSNNTGEKITRTFKYYIFSDNITKGV